MCNNMKDKHLLCIEPIRLYIVLGWGLDGFYTRVGTAQHIRVILLLEYTYLCCNVLFVSLPGVEMKNMYYRDPQPLVFRLPGFTTSIRSHDYITSKGAVAAGLYANGGHKGEHIDKGFPVGPWACLNWEDLAFGASIFILVVWAEGCNKTSKAKGNLWAQHTIGRESPEHLWRQRGHVVCAICHRVVSGEQKAWRKQ